MGFQFLQELQTLQVIPVVPVGNTGIYPIQNEIRVSDVDSLCFADIGQPGPMTAAGQRVANSGFGPFEVLM